MDGDQHTPWCTLDSYTKFCTCGTCTPEQSREIAAMEFTPKQIYDLFSIATHADTQPGDRADAIYLFVNKCVTQKRPIRTEEAHLITSYMVQMMTAFSTPRNVHWMIKVLLDLYEHDQHILDFPVVHVLVAYTLHVVTVCNVREDADALINSLSALVTLVSGLFCYGFQDADLDMLDLPVEIDRPADAKSLECIFEIATFCQGVTNLLVYASTMFDKWYERESLFHWDLAIIASVVKSRLFRHADLRASFDRVILEKLFELSADYTSLVILAKTRPLPWKRPLIECCSVVLTGSPSYLLGIALIDQTSGTRRFGLFLHALLKHYHTIDAVREACMSNPVMSPPPISRAVAMLMALSGRDRNHISRMMRRLRHHVEPSSLIGAEDSTTSPMEVPEPVRDTPERQELDAAFLAELVREQEEEEERRRSSMKSAGSKKKKKQQKSKKKTVPEAAATEVKTQPSTSEAAGTSDDDDDCIYTHYHLSKPVPDHATVPTSATSSPLPFGPPVKKRPHRKRKPIRPLSQTVTQPEPVQEEEPVAEPEPLPTPEPVQGEEPVAEPEILPTPEPVREEELVAEPTPEPVQEEESVVFQYAHTWLQKIPEWVMSPNVNQMYPDRELVHTMDVLRWTPLVYAHSARASFERSVGVQNVFWS